MVWGIGQFNFSSYHSYFWWNGSGTRKGIFCAEITISPSATCCNVLLWFLPQLPRTTFAFCYYLMMNKKYKKKKKRNKQTNKTKNKTKQTKIQGVSIMYNCLLSSSTWAPLSWKLNTISGTFNFVILRKMVYMTDRQK